MLRPHDLGSHPRGSQQTNPHAREAYKKPGEHLTALSLCAEARGLFLQDCRDPATRTRIRGPSKHDKTPCSNGEKSPWRSKPTPPGPRGLHPAGALARTHRNHRVQNTIPTGAATSQVSSKPRESARTPPEARGLLSDTTRRGTLSKIQEYCLSLAKTKAKRLLQGLDRILRFARGLAPRPHAKQA